VLRVVLVCALILSQVPAHGEEQKLIANTRMILLVSKTALAQRCGPQNAHAYACTQFVGQRLSADCAGENALWTIRPKAEYVALMYIVDQDYIRHEKRHIGDMEKAVTEHLSALESERFSAASSCERAATSAVARFSASMQEFARESNAQRH